MQQVLLPVERVVVRARPDRIRSDDRLIALEGRLQHSFAARQGRELLLKIMHRGRRNLALEQIGRTVRPRRLRYGSQPGQAARLRCPAALPDRPRAVEAAASRHHSRLQAQVEAAADAPEPAAPADGRCRSERLGQRVRETTSRRPGGRYGGGRDRAQDGSGHDAGKE